MALALARAGYHRAFPDGLETDAGVQSACCRIVLLPDDLDPVCARVEEQIDSSGQQVARKSSALVVVLGAHRFDEPRGGFGVEPEQPVRRSSVVTVKNDQVEIGSI